MKLLLIDGHYYVYRSFFAIRDLKNSKGQPTNAIYGFIKTVRKMVKDLAQSFKPGSSALFILVRRATVDKVLNGLKDFAGKGKVFQTSLNKDEETTLREALEVA